MSKEWSVCFLISTVLTEHTEVENCENRNKKKQVLYVFIFYLFSSMAAKINGATPFWSLST